MPPTFKTLLTTWPGVNSGFTFRDYIKSKHAGLDLLHFYASTHPASGRAEEWAARISNGQIQVNGVTVSEPKYLLRVGDVVSYTRLPWREPPSPSHADVLYEDEHMVALSKPSGLQVLPAAMFHQRTLLTLLQRHYGTPHPAVAAHTAAGTMSDPARSAAAEATSAVPVAAAATASAALEPRDGGTAGVRQQRDGGRGDDSDKDDGHAGRGQSGRCRSGDTRSSRGVDDGAADSPALRGDWPQQQGREQRRRRQPPQQQQGCEKPIAGRALGVPAPVHRLGRGTSGLLLCARTPEARRRLTELMTGKTAAVAAEVAAGAAAAAPATSSSPIVRLSQSEASPPVLPPRPPPLRKLYRALVQGIVREDEGRVDVPIGPINYPGVDGGLFAATPDGKPAASVWRVLERRQDHRAPEGGSDAVHLAPGSSASYSVPQTPSQNSEDPGVARAGDQGLLGPDVGGCGAPDGEVHGVAAAPGDEVRLQPAQRARLEQLQAPPLEDQTLMEVEILTGRPHQIRIHMAAMGHPLVGDPLYGIGGRPRAGLDSEALADGEGALSDPRDCGFGRPGDCGYHLHSLELHLPHPATGEPLVLRAPPPQLLRTAAERGRGREGQGAGAPAGAGAPEAGRADEEAEEVVVVYVDMGSS